MPLNYPMFEQHGKDLSRWMNDANDTDCPIQMTTLTMANMLHSQDWNIVSNIECIPQEWNSWISCLGLPVEDINVEHTKSSYRSHTMTKLTSGVTSWIGRTGPGVIFLESLRRAKDSHDPYMSELSKIAYERDFPVGSLKYVFVHNIIEEYTVPLVKEQIYMYQEGLQYPCKEPQTFEFPTPEFSALLGTPIGRIVGSLVLGAYGQGIKRIARIVTFHTGIDLHELNIRFDIENL